FFVDGGDAEFRLGEDVQRLSAGAIVFTPTGMPHAARNVGDEPLRFRALFSSHLVDLRYLERNPAPGTEGRDPQTVVYDARSAATTASAASRSSGVSSTRRKSSTEPSRPVRAYMAGTSFREMSAAASRARWRPAQASRRSGRSSFHCHRRSNSGVKETALPVSS